MQFPEKVHYTEFWGRVAEWKLAGYEVTLYQDTRSFLREAEGSEPLEPDDKTTPCVFVQDPVDEEKAWVMASYDSENDFYVLNPNRKDVDGRGPSTRLCNVEEFEVRL